MFTQFFRRSPKAGQPLPPPPTFLKFRSSTSFIISTVCVAVFTDIFLYGLVVPVLPFSMTVRAGVPENEVQRWNAILLACYGIALFVGSPIAGFYADHSSSRRTPLLIGLIALAGATVMLCVGRSVGVFVAGRLLQGLSAGVVWSVGLALMVDTMGNRVGLAMGYTGIAISLGLLLSPLIGGYVYAGSGYYAVYYVAFGLIAFDIALRLLMIEQKTARPWLELERAEAETAADIENNAGIQSQQQETAAAAVAATEPEKAGQQPAAAADGAPTAAPATAAPPRIRGIRRVLILLRSARLWAALFGSVIMASVVTSFDTVLPLFVEDIFGWSSSAAGLLFFAPYLPPLIISPVVGLLADRFGGKWLTLFGMVTSIPVLVCLRFVDENTVRDKVLLAALLAVAGATLTFGNVPLMAEISFSIEARSQQVPGLYDENGANGLGYGLYTMSFALGSAVGSLASGYIQIDYGWPTVAWALALFCAAGIIPTILWIGEFPAKPGHNTKDGPKDSDEGTVSDNREQLQQAGGLPGQEEGQEGETSTPYGGSSAPAGSAARSRPMD